MIMVSLQHTMCDNISFKLRDIVNFGKAVITISRFIMLTVIGNDIKFVNKNLSDWVHIGFKLQVDSDYLLYAAAQLGMCYMEITLKVRNTSHIFAKICGKRVCGMM